MSYDYANERHHIFTENGQVIFLKIRDATHRLLELAGAARWLEIVDGITFGDAWVMLACVDRLVELGEIREITKDGVKDQYRVFVNA